MFKNINQFVVVGCLALGGLVALVLTNHLDNFVAPILASVALSAFTAGHIIVGANLNAPSSPLVSTLEQTISSEPGAPK